MTPAAIELFVDRICGYFPTTNIARNTVKSAWRLEDELIELSDEQAKSVLKKIQVEPQFPNLARVKQIIKQANNSDQQSEYCGNCMDGWVYLSVQDEFYGTYRDQVARCKCQGGKVEATVDLPEVQELDYDIRETDGESDL